MDDSAVTGAKELPSLAARKIAPPVLIALRAEKNTPVLFSLSNLGDLAFARITGGSEQAPEEQAPLPFALSTSVTSPSQPGARARRSATATPEAEEAETTRLVESMWAILESSSP
jgi:hypothetical protein